jgi:hypothetical protein
MSGDHFAGSAWSQLPRRQGREVDIVIRNALAALDNASTASKTANRVLQVQLPSRLLRAFIAGRERYCE